MAGESGRDLPLDRLKLVIGVGAREIEENRADPGQIAAAPLQRFDRIGEGRRFRVFRDCLASAFALRARSRRLARNRLASDDRKAALQKARSRA